MIWWEEWTPAGYVTIARRRRSENGRLALRFEDVVAAREAPDGAFIPPMP